jgi:hypothetical protein
MKRKSPYSGLGLINTTRRQILSGTKYDRFIPRPDNKINILLEDSDIPEIIAAMREIIYETPHQTQQIAIILEGESDGTVKDICQKVFDFAYNHINYNEDKKGREQLREPARAWADRLDGIDCDCYSILISSILYNLGIPHKLRVTEYANKGYFQHVYVVALDGNKEIPIDPVVNRFDYEKPYTDKQDFKMKLQLERLSGFGEMENPNAEPNEQQQFKPQNGNGNNPEPNTQSQMQMNWIGLFALIFIFVLPILITYYSCKAGCRAANKKR